MQGPNIHPAHGDQLTLGKIELQSQGCGFAFNQAEGLAHGQDVTCQEAIIQVVDGDVQTGMAELVSQGLKGGSKQPLRQTQ